MNWRILIQLPSLVAVVAFGWTVCVVVGVGR